MAINTYAPELLTLANVAPPTHDKRSTPDSLLRVMALADSRIPLAFAFVDMAKLPDDLRIWADAHADMYPDGVLTYRLRWYDCQQTHTDEFGSSSGWSISEQPRHLSQFDHDVFWSTDFEGLTFNGAGYLAADKDSHDVAEQRLTESKNWYANLMANRLQAQAAELTAWLADRALAGTPSGNAPKAELLERAVIPFWVESDEKYNDSIIRLWGVVSYMISKVDYVLMARAKAEEINAIDTALDAGEYAPF